MKNNEFKITKTNDATVYTLESASSGGTSSGSVASISSPMGGVRKRGDNLISQEAQEKEAPKPRNFVAKNAKMGGAGQHKDKKKEQKQGVAKHKKPYMEEMDDLKSQFLSMLKDKGIRHRVHGSPDQEKQRTKDMIAQKGSPSKPSAPSTSSAYRDGFQDGLRGHRNPRSSNIHGPMSNDYDSGYHAGVMKKENGTTDEAFNPNSVNAQHAANIKAHHRAELKKKADAGDENAKKRLKAASEKDTARRAEADFNMNREGMAEAATDDPKFQKMMGNIQKTTPDPFSGYVAVSYAGEKPSKKIKGATVNGKPVPTTTDDPGQLINDLKFTSDRIEQQLMAIGKKHGWDLIDPGQGQGYSELYFDTNREYTTNTQRQLATNIVKTVNEINKFFASMNSSLQATGLPGYRVSVWQGMGANGNTNQFDDINQITNIAKGKSAKEDPGPAIGTMILKYLPGYEADSELGYDPQDFVNAKKVASIYIAKGERAGLQAQIQLDSHVSDMIDELLSDNGGHRLRTISSDDLDEGYDTAYADQRYKDHEAAMAAKEWEREHNRIKQQHPGGIHGVASGVDAERWLIPYRMLLKNNFKPTETDDRFEYLMQVALKLKGANAGFSSTTGMSNAAEVFGLQPEEQTLVAKLIRSAPHVSEIEKYMRDNTVSEAEAIGGGVDAKGRTQQEWIKMVKAKFPDAKIVQSKMINGPCFATLPDGKKISWKKVEQGVSEGEGNVEIGQQMANDGITYSPEKENELIGLMAQYMKKSGMSSKSIRYYLSYDEDYISDQLSYLPKKGQQGVAEGTADYNFDIEDLKRLERIRDLPTLKTQALALISKPSVKPMKPEKVEWFKNALDNQRMNSPMKVIKLMYDLLLSGEGNAVVGTRSSMNPNSYRQRFGEQGVEEGWGMGGYATAIGSEIQPGKGHEMGENDEYDGEGSMIKNDLHTIVRVSTHLSKALTDDENLPTWVIEKIAQTKGMIVSVMDYMISQHEMGQVYQKENHPDEKEDKALIRKMVKQQALKQETNDPYMAELHAQLAEKISKNAPVKTYIDDFAKASKTPNAKGHHQFKNKSPEKVRQMAIAASYGAKNPSKKKK